jgi:hypothetical protein
MKGAGVTGMRQMLRARARAWPRKCATWTTLSSAAHTYRRGAQSKGGDAGEQHTGTVESPRSSATRLQSFSS